MAVKDKHPFSSATSLSASHLSLPTSVATNNTNTTTTHTHTHSTSSSSSAASTSSSSTSTSSASFAKMEWSAEEEIELFKALRGLKPIGINKHFFMACICERLAIALKRPINPDVVWAHLGTMYNLELLDSLEPLPFPSAQSDFELPGDEESGFAGLMEAKRRESEGEEEEEDVEDEEDVEGAAGGAEQGAEEVAAAESQVVEAGGGDDEDGAEEANERSRKAFAKIADTWTQATLGESNMSEAEWIVRKRGLHAMHEAVLNDNLAYIRRKKPERVTSESLAQLLKLRSSLSCTANSAATSSASTSNSGSIIKVPLPTPIENATTLVPLPTNRVIGAKASSDEAVHVSSAASSRSADTATSGAGASTSASASASTSATTSASGSKPRLTKRTRGSKSIESNSPSTTPPPNAAQNKRRRN